jgi:hypothetical protein
MIPTSNTGTTLGCEGLGLREGEVAALRGHVDHLERDTAIEIRVVRGIDDAHTALSQALEHVKPRDAGRVAEQRALDARARSRVTRADAPAPSLDRSAKVRPTSKPCAS